MKWKDFGKFGLGIAGVIFPQIAVIEETAKVFTTKPTGAEKKAAVLKLAKASLSMAEQVTDRDLLDDAEMVTAAEAVIDAVVAFNNLAEKKKALPAA